MEPWNIGALVSEDSFMADSALGRLRRGLGRLLGTMLGAALVLLVVFRSVVDGADSVPLKNGMVLEGVFAPITSVAGEAPNPLAVDPKPKQIVICDDRLRRVFVGTKMLADKFSPVTARSERFLIKQRANPAGRGVASVGPILRVTPFDEQGWRIFSMSTSDGQVDVIQGITEITPTYTRVAALQGSGNYVWDMSIATSTLSRETLSKILRKNTNPKSADDRLKIVRLYIQSERIQDARAELDGVIKDFPGLAALPDVAKELTQMAAQRLIKEIELRRDAGQPLLAIAMLEKFPSEGVAGETLLKVRDMLGEFKDLGQQGQQVVLALDEQTAQLKDEQLRTDLGPILTEIKTDLNIHNLGRMADFQRLATDATLTAENKVSLAISGWILGKDSGLDNMSVSRSLMQVRDLVRQYLRSKRKPDRDAILAQLESLEGATPENIAKLIAHMRPPLEPAAPAAEEPEAAGETPPAAAAEAAAAPPAAADEGAKPDSSNTPQPPAAGDAPIPGLLERTVAGLPEDPEIKYSILLPPEYSPYRRYPCIVTLNGGGTTPLQQIDWWAGDYNAAANTRYGQASRHGYVVIAPRWLREHQRKYEYSAREHAAVLYTLRDACKAFSIDTDRVFLSGHSLGGDAAWDIGLAHPDLWAGVIPIVATSDKHVGRYWQNAKYVPLYFVSGEKDGDKRARNATDWNRYLQRLGYDAMVVEYQGRGHEHFHDEIQNLFKWMNLHRRNFYPREFEFTTMRPWDTFFWWVDVAQMPDRLMILPSEWPKTGVKEAENTAKIQGNTVRVSTPAGKVTVWLTPELVSFENKVTVYINNRRHLNVTPTRDVLLDDVRTRGDRQHPFWAKAESL
jgi:predicted esterase